MKRTKKRSKSKPRELTPKEMAKLAEKRVAEFVDPRNWDISSRGNPYRTFRRCNVTIFRDKFDPELFRWSIAHEDGEVVYSEDKFEAIEYAKYDLADAIGAEEGE